MHTPLHNFCVAIQTVVGAHTRSAGSHTSKFPETVLQQLTDVTPLNVTHFGAYVVSLHIGLNPDGQFTIPLEHTAPLLEEDELLELEDELEELLELDETQIGALPPQINGFPGLVLSIMQQNNAFPLHVKNLGSDGKFGSTGQNGEFCASQHL